MLYVLSSHHPRTSRLLYSQFSLLRAHRYPPELSRGHRPVVGLQRF